MTADGRYAELVQRVVDLTGVLRTRAADVERSQRNGSRVVHVEAASKQLERVVRDLEKAVA